MTRQPLPRLWRPRRRPEPDDQPQLR